MISKYIPTANKTCCVGILAGICGTCSEFTGSFVCINFYCFSKGYNKPRDILMFSSINFTGSERFKLYQQLNVTCRPIRKSRDN